MGFPYHELVPAAILLDNPGVTRTEFARLLNKTYPSTCHEFNKEDPWSSSGGMLVDEYHQGLEGLARVLRLSETGKYRQFQMYGRDRYGLEFRPPSLCPLSEENSFFPEFKFEVDVFKSTTLGKPVRTTDCSWIKLSEGDLWEDLYGFRGGLVSKIYSEQKPDDTSKESEDNPTIWKYDMEIQGINREYDKFVFGSKKEVYKRFPLFSPTKRYDWSKEKGNFSCLFSNDFGWTMKQGKYYLAPETFDKIQDSFLRTRSLGYHDLILTAEAIKQKAWKLLSYKGVIHMRQFLNDFPASKARYERAIWDSQTSLYAKHTGMATSEFLRWRQGGS